MYQIFKTDGTILGMTESVNYIRIHENGCFVGTSRENATGVAFQSVAYNLLGHNNIEGADVVSVSEIDGGHEAYRAKTTLEDIDAMSIDLDYRLTLAELGVEE